MSNISKIINFLINNKFLDYAKNRNFLSTFEQFLIIFEINLNQNLTLSIDSNIIQFLLNNINHIFEYGFVIRENHFNQNQHMFQSIPSKFANKRNHFFKRMSEILHMESIEFMKHLEVPFDDEQSSYLWILIELSMKRLHRLLYVILNNNELMKCYNEESFMKKYFKEIYEIMLHLDSMKFDIDSNFLKSFHQLYPKEEDQSLMESNKEKDENNELKLEVDNLKSNNEKFPEKNSSNKNEFESTKIPIQSLTKVRDMLNITSIKLSSPNRLSEADYDTASTFNKETSAALIKPIKITIAKLATDKIRKNIVRFKQILEASPQVLDSSLSLNAINGRKSSLKKEINTRNVTLSYCLLFFFNP